MFETIDLAWVERNPKSALDMIDRLMTERDEAQALARVAAAGYAAAAGEGWRPIETAPRDGTDVLVGCWVSGENGSKRWSSWTIKFEGLAKFGVSDFGCDGEFGDKPTHWRPLPPPPAGDAATKKVLP